MKSIGDYLKEARIRKKYSKVKVEAETKIKKEFIEAIEDENWELLPEFPVVVGFVKSIAQILGLNQNQVLAFLRRDYPPKKVNINPKPDLMSKFSWSPKLTFFAVIIFILLSVFTYLGYQYFNFIRPPNLQVISPKEGQIVTTNEVKVLGKTTSEAVVKVNNQPVLVDEDGNFSTTIDIFAGTEEIEVKAISRSGKETVIIRKIKPELEGT